MATFASQVRVSPMAATPLWLVARPSSSNYNVLGRVSTMEVMLAVRRRYNVLGDVVACGGGEQE